MGLLNKLWQQWHRKPSESGDSPVVTGDVYNYAPHFIQGERLIIESNQVLEAINPRTGRFERRVYTATPAAIQHAVQSAKEAKLEWGQTPYIKRLQVIEHFKNTISVKQDVLNDLLQQECGLYQQEISAEIEQTLEAIIYALTAMQAKGSSTPVWGGLDVWVQHSMLPLGVVSIVVNEQQTLKTMVSEIVVALLSGNALIVKAHYCQSLLPVLLGDWLAQAGLPNGAYNVLQGDDDISKALHVHPDVNGVSYLLTQPALPQAHVRQRQTMPAHNFLVIDSDIDLDKVWQEFLRSHNPRVHVPIWVVIGQDAEELSKRWRQRLSEQEPVVFRTQAMKQQCSEFLQKAVMAGATLEVDGSQGVLPENGWLMGMSLITGVSPNMQLHHQAPHRSCVMVMQVPDVTAALDVITNTPRVGAVNVFTETMSSMNQFKQQLDQVEVVSFNRVEMVTSLNLPCGNIAHPWAMGGQHAARWQFYVKHQLITGATI